MKVKQYTIKIVTKHQPSATSELANSESELDGHGLACSLKKVPAPSIYNMTGKKLDN